MNIDFGDKVNYFERILIKKVGKVCLDYLKQPQNVEFSFSFVDDDQMQDLNLKTRKINKVTDVLSFPNFSMAPGEIVGPDKINPLGVIFLGDIVVCKQQIIRQANEYKNSYKKELIKMVIHSILHLFGYDHINQNDERLMSNVENVIFNKIVHKFQKSKS